MNELDIKILSTKKGSSLSGLTKDYKREALFCHAKQPRMSRCLAD